MAEEGFDALIRDLSNLGPVSRRQARRSVQQTAMETKKEYRKIARKNPLGRQYADSIDYDLRGVAAFGQTEYQADIGPNLGRYGGRSGKNGRVQGGLIPSAGIFDDPDSSGGIRRPPDRSRRQAEKFAEKEVEQRAQRALDETLKENGL